MGTTRVRLRRLAAALVLAAAVAFAPPGGAAEGEGDGAGPFAFEVKEINPGLPPASPPLRLDTPRAALESYLDAIGRQEFARAAHVLNLNAVPREAQADQAPQLALMLAFVLRRHDLVDWADIPDQPDARVIPGLQQSAAPYSRRSLQLGEVRVRGRPVPISLQRFVAEAGEPVWLFSPFVVDRLPDIYAASRPGLFSELVPLERRLESLGRPSLIEWLGVAALLLVASAIGAAVFLLVRLCCRALPARRAHPVRRSALPLAVMVAAGLFTLATDRLFLLTGPVASNVGIAAEIVALVATGWLFLGVMSAATLSLSERYVVPLPADDPQNRRTKTTVYVVRRVGLVLIALLILAYILARAGVFASFGLSVLASAGVIGVLVAIAAQPLLGNIVAGLQIALTDPAGIGDVVVYEGTWAVVEDISFAHTVLRTWTDTRLIVPHADLLSKSFENWSKGGEDVWRIVRIPVDYTVDIDRIRREAEAIVTGDARSIAPPRVEMVEADAESATVWIWVRGTTALSSWTLHNDMRERILRSLKDLDGGAYLPRSRHVLAGRPDEAWRWEAAAAPGPEGRGPEPPGPRPL